MIPPPVPYHVLVQQILAVVLQYRSISQMDLTVILEPFLGAAKIDGEEFTAILSYMISTQTLILDGGMILMGPQGEKLYGYRHFMNIYSVFDAPQQVRVLHGNRELGYVDDMLFRQPEGKEVTISLGGRSWRVVRMNFNRLEAIVEPITDHAKSSWLGSSLPLSFALAQSIKAVATSGISFDFLSERGVRALQEIREDYSWLSPEGTCLIHQGSTKTRWWTFAGGRVNQTLAALLIEITGKRSKGRNLWIDVEGGLKGEDQDRLKSVDDQALSAVKIMITPEPDIKFAQSLPSSLKTNMLARRYTDYMRAKDVLNSRVTIVEPD